MSEQRTYYDGKYTVRNAADGGLEFLRHGEPWPGADDLKFNNLIGAMFREQLDADAGLATLRAKLAEAEKELARSRENRLLICSHCGHGIEWDSSEPKNTVSAMQAHELTCAENPLRAVLAAAEADCAAMREAMLGLQGGALYMGRECHFGDHTSYELGHASKEVIGAFNAALARPTGQALLNELSAARKVCEAYGAHEAAREESQKSFHKHCINFDGGFDPWREGVEGKPLLAIERKAKRELAEAFSAYDAARTDLPTILDRLANERAKLAIAMEALNDAFAVLTLGGEVDHQIKVTLKVEDALRRVNELEKQHGKT